MRRRRQQKGSRAAWRVERGEDESFEFTMVIGPLVIMVMLIAFATVARSELMPAFSAASECVRAAVTTMDADTGKELGTDAALGMLASNFVNPAYAQVDITPGPWQPDMAVTCSVSYAIDLRGIPFFAEMTGGSIPVRSAVTLHTEANTSRWQ